MKDAIPYIPIDQKGWRLAMGLRPLEDSKWLEVDAHRDEELALKDVLIKKQRDVVVATRREGDGASAELLATVKEFLGTYYPAYSTETDPNEHPIVAASRLIQEDLCVMVRSDQWRMQAACVCFPSRWNLVEKIGTTLDEIHGPVPLYGEELSQPTNAVFDRLTPAKAFWRLNWTLLDNPSLSQPGSGRREPDAMSDNWFFRVERQTIRQMPVTKAIVFTLRTYVASVDELCGSEESFCTNLLNALDTAPKSVQEYKGWIGVSDRLRSVLGQKDCC